MLSQILKNKILSALFVGGVITLCLSLGIFGNFFNILNLRFTDSLYNLDNPSDEIVIIAVDDKSIQPMPQGLGRFSQWSRENFTKMLTILEKENPKVIALDFIFHTPTSTVPVDKFKELQSKIGQLENNKEKLVLYEEFLKNYQSTLNNPIDNQFAEKLGEIDNLVLAATLAGENMGLIPPLPKFAQNKSLGITQSYPDKDGVLRKVDVNFLDAKYNNFAVATVKEYLKSEPDLSTENNKFLVNFFGEPFSYKMTSFVDVLNQNFEQGLFKDKIVLVGSTASKEIHDEYLTPRSNRTPMPGVEILANTIQTILDGKFLQEQSKVAQVLTVALLTIGLAIALNYLGILASIILTILTLILYWLAAHYFYSKGLIINMVYPFAAIVMAFIGSYVYKYFITDKNKRELKNAFGHYVSNELVEQISKNPEMVKLGGEKKVVTVFFSDIKDSTTHSEKTAIESWVSQINEYFTVMETIIKSNGGTLDKYEGDAVMAFWNAPISQIDHVKRAYLAALKMREALKKLHEKWQKENKPLIEFRIGINTGEALVGNFGSANRFDYTVMGDTVNTASRLESSANKAYGTSIIVSGTNGFDLTEIQQNFLVRELDSVFLPGKKEPVKLFQLLGLNSGISQSVKEQLQNYASGLESYRKKDFAKAIEYFSKISSDRPAQIMLERCQKLQNVEKIEELSEEMIFHIVNK